ncbi:glycosyltransferase [Pelosinus sp. sgz500959]|uniref:glycosyltransferase n=1 Tax=Pelosinus sp. sgz500959 TaxID=3242472 RepID=UPI00366C2E32
MNDRILISLCMITKNEEHCIARCLNSVEHLVDEMIVVDTGSNDHTVKIAAEHGAKIFYFTWVDDFSAARNYAISKAQGHWILVLDADEILVSTSRNELLDFLLTSPGEGYYLKINSNLDHGNKSVDDYVVRLFKNTPDYQFAGAIHEQIAGSIQSRNLNSGLVIAPFTIKHDGYLRKEVEGKHKFIRNTTLMKKELIKNPQDPFLNYCLGIEYLRNKNFPEASLLFDKTITLLQGDEGYVSQVLTALLLVKLTIPEDLHAEESFCKGIQSLPDNGDLSCLYGVWLMQHKRFSEAAQILEMGKLNSRELLELSQFNALLGDAYFLAGISKQGIEYYIDALCEDPKNLYPLMRILAVCGCEPNRMSWEPLVEKLTWEFTKELFEEAQKANMFELRLATILLAIIERTKVNDITGTMENCRIYLQMLKIKTPHPLRTHIYLILSLTGEELLLQSQFLKLAGEYDHNTKQTFIYKAMGNLLLISFLVKNLSPKDPLTFWEELFIGETYIDCQSR